MAKNTRWTQPRANSDGERMISKLTTKDVNQDNAMLLVTHQEHEEDYWSTQDHGIFSSYEAMLNELSGHGLPILLEDEEYFDKLETMELGDHYSYRHVEFLG